MSLNIGLLGHWKLDETSGNYADSLGLTQFERVGSVGTTAGKIGNAATFTTSATRARAAANNNLRIPAGTSGTFAGWFRLNALPSQQAFVLSRWDGADPNDYFIGILPTGAVQCGVSAVGTVTAVNGSSVVLNQWHFLVGWYDHTVGVNGTVYVQLDNGAVFSNILPNPRASKSNSRSFLSVINDGGFGATNGAIDSVSVWSRVLTPDERTRLWNNGNGLDFEQFSDSGRFAVNGKVPVAVWCPSRDILGNGTATLNDLVGSNNGTLTNMDPTTDWVADTGAGGIRALDFDGVNDLVRAPRVPTFPFSISGWFKLPANQNGVICGFFSSTSNEPQFSVQFTTGGNVQLNAEGQGTGQHAITSSSTYLVNTWHHFVVVFTSATSRTLFVNGVSQGAATVSRSIAASIDRFSIGIFDRPTPAAPFTGRIDDIRLFNQSLDLADTVTLWNSGNGRGRIASNLPNYRRNNFFISNMF